MAYQKIGWQNKPSAATPITASRLEHMDEGIYQAHAQLAQKVNKDEITNGIYPLEVPGWTYLYADLPEPSEENKGGYLYCTDGDGINGAGNYVSSGSSWYFGGTGDQGYSILKDKLSEVKLDTFVANIPVESNIVVLAEGDHKYKATSTNNWQSGSFLIFDNLDITEGTAFHVGRKSGDNFGNQPCIITYYDASNEVISTTTINKTALDEAGGFDRELVAPSGTHHVKVQFSIISNASADVLPTIGVTYTMKGCYVYVGNATIDYHKVSNVSVGYNDFAETMKPYIMYVYGTNGGKLPNFDTATKTLTIYKDTRIINFEGVILYTVTEDTVIPVSEAAQNNILVFDLSERRFKLIRFGVNLTNYMHIVFGAINRYSGKGYIQCGYTIDGYPVGSDNLIKETTLQSPWNNRIEEIKTAQGSKFTFAIQTDTHYCSNASKRVINSTIEGIRNFKMLSHYIGFDFMANLGDIIQGYAGDTGEEMRADLTTVMREYTTGISCPFLVALGNHDPNVQGDGAIPNDLPSPVGVRIATAIV